MLIRFIAIIIVFTITGLYGSTSKSNDARRAGEYANAICEPNKRHLDLEGCGECICNSHGYGSVCEKVYCPKVYKRPVDERECTPYDDFQTHCHYCKCSSGGIPIDCEEKQLGCMDKMLERLKIERFREPSQSTKRSFDGKNEKEYDIEYIDKSEE